MDGVVNTFKWSFVFLLIGLGVVGNYYYSEIALLPRIMGLLALAATAGFLALHTESGKRFARFAIDSRNELRKVVWPTGRETLQMTGLVITVIAIVGLILWGVDTLLLRAIAWLIGYGA